MHKTQYSWARNHFSTIESKCQNEESRKKGITNPIQASLLNVVLLSMQRLKKENRMEWKKKINVQKVLLETS